ncbi:MAG TPA: SirB2 family protein [Pseudomonas sp.]|nr:SirB2 family protein [Pseudomonas sp.]
MIEFYPGIKLVHVAAIMSSGTLFAVRGAAVLAGKEWAVSAPARYLSYAVDIVLLTAALLLLTILPGALFANGWLIVKVVLLVCYILLGILAFRSPWGIKSRRIFYIGALLVYLQIYSIARAHHPLGMLHFWLGTG